MASSAESASEWTPMVRKTACGGGATRTSSICCKTSGHRLQGLRLPKSRDEEMTEAFVTSNAENVKPLIFRYLVKIRPK